MLDEVGDRDAPTGTRAWALWLVGEAGLRRKDLEQDVESFQGLIREIEQHRAWEPLGFENFGSLCERELGLHPSQANSVLAAKRGQMLATVISRAENAEPLAEHGAIGNGRSRDDHHNSTRRTQADYLTARIARDRPDIHEAMKRGEYSSVRAAALDAGIVKPRASMPFHDMSRLAAAIRRRLNEDELAELLAHLTGEETS